MVGGVIENFSLREARKQVMTLGLVYDTSSDDLDAAIQAVKDILESQELVRDDYAVRFTNFGDSALEMTVIYWVVPPSAFFDVVHAVNVAIKRRFDDEGWGMAFPSQSLYIESPVQVVHPAG